MIFKSKNKYVMEICLRLHYMMVYSIQINNIWFNSYIYSYNRNTLKYNVSLYVWSCSIFILYLKYFLSILTIDITITFLKGHTSSNVEDTCNSQNEAAGFY